jgi:hypothetical protein
MAAQLFHVGDEVPGRVVFEARMRAAATAAALIETTMRKRSGSKNRREVSLAPAPGPPCTNTAGFPFGLPHSS